MDGFDEELLQIRVENKQVTDELEKQFRKREDEAIKLRRSEISALEKSIGDLRKELEGLPEIRRSVTARVDEESRLSRLIDELRLRIDSIRRSDEEYTRTIRLLEDGRRQDSKRLVDMQGELTSVRKRSDDHHGRLELALASQKKIEARLNEFNTIETERRVAMDKFLESQSMKDVERERIWKEMQARFSTIEGQIPEIENQLQTLDATHRAVKRTQQTVDEVAQKVERRIIELSEIQRLAEERFRQEWVTFKADDQKRWTNYTLSLDEQRSETTRTFQKLADRVSHLEDELQVVQDIMNQISEQTEKRLQSLVAVVHEWVSNFERTLGRSG
jgi:prefoldin subunit 5